MDERFLTRNIGPGRTPPDLGAYASNGGYEGARAALRTDPDALRQIVLDSRLRGRGGAGFPTGAKWGALPPFDASSRPRRLVCNFDEMEPGTYKDRVLVEGDPHQLVEGMIVAGWGCRCDEGWIFLRGEYGVVRSRLERALEEARRAGFLGPDVLGTGWSFDVRVHLSAGRYICGEETALLNSLEGRRANPRGKPPFPPIMGAWGKPTVVHNVETLCCLPHIALRGAAWWNSLGKAKDSGVKMYAASGPVVDPHAVELPMGSTLREVLDEMGGMREGHAFRAALPGGASTRFLGPDRLDHPLDYDSMRAIGGFLGTGTAIVVDDRTCIVALVRNLIAFFARESCGWCTPCREGLPWVRQLLEDLEAGRAEPGDLDLIAEQAKRIGPNTFCALAMGAVQPLESALSLFREDFEAHLRLGRCPRRVEGA